MTRTVHDTRIFDLRGSISVCCAACMQGIGGPEDPISTITTTRFEYGFGLVEESVDYCEPCFAERCETLAREWHARPEPKRHVI